MDNVKPLVKIGGLLFIAIYNDLGPITDRWEKIKRRIMPFHGPSGSP